MIVQWSQPRWQDMTARVGEAGSIGRLAGQLIAEQPELSRSARLRRAYAALCCTIGERGPGGPGVLAMLGKAEQLRFRLQREGAW